jgi:chromosome segregation ATPase
MKKYEKVYEEYDEILQNINKSITNILELISSVHKVYIHNQQLRTYAEKINNQRIRMTEIKKIGWVSIKINKQMSEIKWLLDDRNNQLNNIKHEMRYFKIEIEKSKTDLHNLLIKKNDYITQIKINQSTY